MALNDNRETINGGNFDKPETDEWRPYWVGGPMDHDGPGKSPDPPKDWPGGTGRRT